MDMGSTKHAQRKRNKLNKNISFTTLLYPHKHQCPELDSVIMFLIDIL